MIFLGIDPGASGGLAVVIPESTAVTVWPMPSTEADIYHHIAGLRDEDAFCVLEKVGGMPGQGGSASFNFGRNVGVIVGALIACQVPFIEVAPGRWKKHFSLIGKTGRSKTVIKNASKAYVQKRFPNVKFTHATAEAALLALYARETYHQ